MRPVCHADALQRPIEAMRICDYVVDPISHEVGDSRRPAVQHERWHECRAPSADPPGSASGPQARTYVLGYSVEEFAPAVAGLTDHAPVSDSARAKEYGEENGAPVSDSAKTKE